MRACLLQSCRVPNACVRWMAGWRVAAAALEALLPLARHGLTTSHPPPHTHHTRSAFAAVSPCLFSLLSAPRPNLTPLPPHSPQITLYCCSLPPPVLAAVGAGGRGSPRPRAAARHARHGRPRVKPRAAAAAAVSRVRAHEQQRMSTPGGSRNVQSGACMCGHERLTPSHTHTRAQARTRTPPLLRPPAVTCRHLGSPCAERLLLALVLSHIRACLGVGLFTY